MPPILLTLGRQLSQCRDFPCCIANDLLESFSELCELRASIKDGTLTDPPTILTALLGLDATFVSWEAQLSDHWDYQTIFKRADPESVYDDCYSVYRATSTASTRNVQRAIRVYIHEAILTQINDRLSQTRDPGQRPLHLLSSQHMKSLAVVLEMCSDICASVPYLLGQDKPYAEQLTQPPPAACGYFLLAPLYLAGNAIGVPHEMRQYALGRLTYIGHGLGICQASLLAQMLQAKIEGDGGISQTM